MARSKFSHKDQTFEFNKLFVKWRIKCSTFDHLECNIELMVFN